jgi:hypothetical protein
MATRFAIAAIAVLTIAFAGTRLPLVAADPTQQAQAPQAAQPQQPGMQDMMKMHEQMMAEMKADDAKLDALVKEMNAANGDAKVDAIAAVINELVRQHRIMHGRMGQMHEHMMGMGHGMMRR